MFCRIIRSNPTGSGDLFSVRNFLSQPFNRTIAAALSRISPPDKSIGGCCCGAWTSICFGIRSHIHFSLVFLSVPLRPSVRAAAFLPATSVRTVRAARA